MELRRKKRRQKSSVNIDRVVQPDMIPVNVNAKARLNEISDGECQVYSQNKTSTASDRTISAKSSIKPYDTNAVSWTAFHNTNSKGLPVEKHDSLDASEDEDGDGDESQDESVVSIELIYCEHCKKSYAPETYRRFCQAVDEDGNPKCLRLGLKKRKMFNSAKVRLLISIQHNIFYLENCSYNLSSLKR